MTFYLYMHVVFVVVVRCIGDGLDIVCILRDCWWLHIIVCVDKEKSKASRGSHPSWY
jgi:hypothetical protein